jgi:hypothetical protein
MVATHLLGYVQGKVESVDFKEFRCDVLHPEVNDSSLNIDERQASNAEDQTRGQIKKVMGSQGASAYQVPCSTKSSQWQQA